MRVIILAGGISSRWGHYLGIEKHFAPINGVPIIDNTITLLRQHECEVSIIVREGLESSFDKYSVNISTIPIEFSSLEYYKIKSTIPFWNSTGKTAVIMGDVWFTKKAIGKILRYNRRKLMFFGRQKRNFYTGCEHGEIFAFSFWPEHFDTIVEAVNTLEWFIKEKSIRIAGGWGLYDIVSSLTFLMYPQVIKGFVRNSNFKRIIDVTDDLDTPDDYSHLVACLQKHRVSHLFYTVLSIAYYSTLFVFNSFFEAYVYLRKVFAKKENEINS